MTILYVEDDPEDQDIFKEAISVIAPHTTCYFASDGQEAFKLLQKIIIAPDYIFLDLNMPGMNGKEFLKQLKSTNVLKSIPVVVYSTSNRKVDIDDLKSLGAVDFIVKPNSFMHICEVLKKFI